MCEKCLKGAMDFPASLSLSRGKPTGYPGSFSSVVLSYSPNPLKKAIALRHNSAWIQQSGAWQALFGRQDFSPLPFHCPTFACSERDLPHF